jgi:hypothetical protein
MKDSAIRMVWCECCNPSSIRLVLTYLTGSRPTWVRGPPLPSREVMAPFEDNMERNGPSCCINTLNDRSPLLIALLD